MAATQLLPVVREGEWMVCPSLVKAVAALALIAHQLAGVGAAPNNNRVVGSHHEAQLRFALGGEGYVLLCVVVVAGRENMADAPHEGSAHDGKPSWVAYNHGKLAWSRMQGRVEYKVTA